MGGGNINIVNFEAPVFCETAEAIHKSGPSLYQDPNAPEFLNKIGFNVFCLANNHTMDYGYRAFAKTVEVFSQLSGITTVGAGSWEEAYMVKYIYVNGKCIGFLNITQHEFGVLDDEYYENKICGTAWLLHPIIDELIVEAKKRCDFLIVIPHAGQEHFSQPLPEIKTLYRHFVRMGADAVIGGHPHAIQPCEIYQGKPIAYSLGNFIFDKNFGGNPNWYYGIVAQLRIDENGCISLNTIPIHYDIESRVVDVASDIFINKFLNEIESRFKNDLAYKRYIVNECLKQEAPHDCLFEASGYYTLTLGKTFHLFLRHIKRTLLNKPKIKYEKSHLINNLRCEAHRWVISHIYEINNN